MWQVGVLAYDELRSWFGGVSDACSKSSGNSTGKGGGNIEPSYRSAKAERREIW
jgi:hypothetical protein